MQNQEIVKIIENLKGRRNYEEKKASKLGFASLYDYLEDKIDLNQYLVKHPASTFLVRASGNSMINAGIFPNDILVVDKSVKAESGNVVIAIIDGELTVKRYIKKRSSVILQPENEDYEPIELNGKSEAQIWGVVTSVIHDL